MRNDARPIGEDLPGSPTGAEADAPGAPESPDHKDARDGVKHDRQSHVVNQRAERTEAAEETE
jgi:hypothetical protein